MTAFHFLMSLTLNKHKKSMGNCISQIFKDHFFAFEELLKNDILLSHGMMRLALDWGTKRTCTGV